MQASRKRLRLACGVRQAVVQLVGCVYRLLAGRPAPASDPPRGGGHAKISEIATQISEIATEIPKIATQISEIATEISEIATETSEIATEIPEVATQIPEVATRRF